MDKEYFKEYYFLERNHWWFKVREKIIEDKLEKYTPLSSNLTILNIGAATGKTSEMLSRFGKVTSIEYDKDCCEFTKQYLTTPLIHGSILDLPFREKSFDLVCAFDVIEHVSDDKTAVSEMKRVCRDGGTICITVPAFMQLWSHHDIVNHHYRRYKMKQLTDLFKNNGFIIYKSYFNSLLFLPIFCFRSIASLLPLSWIRKDSGSDFSIYKNGIMNKLLFKIFSFERALLKRITYPVGVSILFFWKK